MIIWRRVACWISKATRTQAYVRARASSSSNAHTYTPAQTHIYAHKYVILIVFPRNRFFRKRASMLRYTYIASLVKIKQQQQKTINTPHNPVIKTH
jgi:hypothetical protein